MDNRKQIVNGKTVLGIELGSTRIKAVLINNEFLPIASGEYEWENQLIDGYWTYNMEDVWQGLQTSYKRLVEDIKDKYGVKLNKLASIGISAMMHGYLPFDKSGDLLVPFRTWRNTTTEEAANILTKEFNFNIPQRWSIAHLYQAILNNEKHINNISFFTTLAGYVHWKLTGEKVLGIGEASGMFPISSNIHNYNDLLLEKFDNLIEEYNLDWNIKDILPKIVNVGEIAGKLTEEGARMLDPSGNLESNIPFCPPEGDAGTGMVATNSISERTGNISAGTSIFAMIVLEKELSNVHTEIDIVTTPCGKPVAMVHCNNFTSDIDNWIRLFNEFLELFHIDIPMSSIYNALYNKALEGEKDCGGLLSYNYYSGEPITSFEEGRPLFVRTPDSNLNIANFMRTYIYSALATLKIGMDILSHEENIKLDQLQGHGGFFKTEFVGQSLMASALNVPIMVMESAGEGGAWGIALLASFVLEEEFDNLNEFLSQKVFARYEGICTEPNKKDYIGFNKFMEVYKKGLIIEKTAINNIVL